MSQLERELEALTWEKDRDGYDGDGRLAEARLRADAFDCDVVIASDDELQLDFDSPLPLPAYFWQRVYILRDRCPGLFLPEREWKQWYSKSGNVHVVVKLAEKLTEIERVALQTILGSDPKRELLNFSRVRVGIEHPILLFKPRPRKLGA